MIAPPLDMTVAEFDEFVLRPENIDRHFEFIGGRIVAVVSNPYSSKVAALILGALVAYLKQHDIGHVTGADGGYRVVGERYIPDVAFITYARQPELAYIEGYVDQAPDLAVEVLSPGKDMTVKVANYLAAGTVVWLANPPEQTVIVFEPGKPAHKFGVDAILPGGVVLPDFQLPVKDIFPPIKGAV